MTLSRVIDLQRGHLFCWVPICLALGIGGYFTLPVEPGVVAWLVWACAAGVGVICARSVGTGAAPLMVGLVLIGCGAGLAGLRAHLVSAPMLDFRYYGPIQGRLIAIDRSISDKPRLLFDRVILSRVDPDRTPDRVRVSLHGDRTQDTALVPGKMLMLTAHLSAPRGPVEPGGFDFRRHAWFQQIGAVGYSRTPVMALAPPGPGAWITLQRWRATLSETVRTHLQDQKGAFAAAVLTGDRSALSRGTIDAMRATNLAHLLAISGLHMGLLTAVMFASLRTAIALIPPIALRVNGKKWAACGALMAASAYLALSGGNVSTQRAFIMVAVMLCAVLLDRRAVTLRAVSVAACLILLMRPEAMLGPGFQMSFAATTCLVWVFGEMRAHKDLNGPEAPPGKLRRWLRPVAALVISSMVAGIATAPIGMAHFNTSATYGLLANLIAVPIMGSVVMPAAVLAAALAPFGLEGVGFWIMGQGIGGILWVADTLSQWPQAVRAVPKPPSVVLPLITFGALWFMLWKGNLRILGAGMVAAAVFVWGVSARPDLLISDDAKLLGVMTPEGRALSRERGNGFAARAWLENDGDPADRAEAFGRWADTPDTARLLEAVTGASAADTAGLCLSEQILLVFSALDVQLPCPTGIGDATETGAVAVFADRAGQVRIATVRAQIGQRPWTPPHWRNARSDASETVRAALQ